MNKLNSISKILKQSSFFSQLSAEILEKLCSIAEEKKFKKGQSIFQQGDFAPGIYVVDSGLVRVYKVGSNGKEHVLHMASAGMTFAEVAVLGDFPCPAYAEAVEETHCVLLPTKVFQKLLQEDSLLLRQILVGMAFWVRSLVNLLDDLVLKDAMGRVAAYLLTESQKQKNNGVVSLSAMKKHIASHLNLTSETLSRTFRQLKELELIQEPEENQIRIVRVTDLKQVAEGNFPRL